MDALPHRTRAEKNIVMIAAVVILLMLGALMTMLLRLAYVRRKRAKEWKERGAQPPAETPTS
jgi:hypothetical protein